MYRRRNRKPIETAPEETPSEPGEDTPKEGVDESLGHELDQDVDSPAPAETERAPRRERSKRKG